MALSEASKAKLQKVFHEYKTGTLRSGSPKGPTVTSHAQAVAIALSESRKKRQP